MVDWFIRLAIQDKVYFVLALAGVVSVLIKWASLELQLKLFAFYPLARFPVETISNQDMFSAFYPQFFILNYGNLLFICHAMMAGFFYSLLLQKSVKKGILFSIPIFCILSQIYTDSYVLSTDNKVVSLGRIAECTFVILWCFCYFRQLLRFNIRYIPENDRIFWTVVSLLFYFIAHFFIIGFLRLTTSGLVIYSLNFIAYTFNYLLCGILILVCFIKFPKTYYE